MGNLMKNGGESRRSGTAVRLAVALALGTAYPCVVPVRAAAAAELELSLTFDIAAQPLDTALLEFSRQAGVQVLATENAVSGKKTQGIRGKYPVGQALRELLKGSGLRYRQTSDRAVTIDTADGSVASSADAALTLAAQDAAATSATPEDSDIEEVVVRGIEFRYAEPSSATKLAMDPKDIPQSLTLVTRDMMDFASIKRFDDIYRVDASSGSTYRRDGFPTAYYRGFWNQGLNAIRIDGFRFIGNIDLDLVGFERFEVVKGPSSILYGQNTLGGTLNAITKQPRKVGAGSLSFEGGSYGHKRGELDFTGPLSADGRWAYRMVGAYEDADSFQDFAGHRSKTVVPSLSFELSDRTRLLLSGYYNKQAVVSDFGPGLQEVDAASGQFRILPVSRSHFFGEPWNDSDLEAYIVNLRGEHQLNDRWTLRVALQGNGMDRSRLNCSAQGNTTPDGMLPGGCWTYLREEDTSVYSGEMNLVGDFDAFGQSHTLFLGADYARHDVDRIDSFDYLDDANHGILFGTSIGFNVLHPVHGTTRPAREGLFFYGQDKSSAAYSGLSAQLLLRANDRLSLLLGGRYNNDRIRSFKSRSAVGYEEFAALPLTNNPAAFFDSTNFVGQAGATFALTRNTNLYLNWGQTYEPKFGREFDPGNPDEGRQLSPEKGDQVEVGLKASMLDERIGLTLAAFTMERSGISQGDREHPGFSIPLGTQRSRGVEFGMSGQVLPGWEIYASAALLDAEFIEGALEGSHAVNAPKRALSVFTSYQFVSGAARGFGAGLGYVYKGGLNTSGLVFGLDDPIPFDFGSINELDLRVFYNASKWEAFVAARNLLDDLSYTATFNNEFRWGINVNPGRTIIAGFKYKLF